MYLFGYLEFVVLLFLPGIAFLEAAQVGSSLSIAGRLGTALGLGMAIDVLMLLLWTYGNFGGTYSYLGGVIVTASVGVTLARVAKGRKSSFFIRPTRADLFVGVLILAQGLLVFVHYVKYPLFPQFRSVDFSQHVMILSDLTRSPPPLSSAVLYYGVHLLMLDLLALTGGTAFVIAQRAMEILVVLSPLIVYAATSAVWRSKSVPLVATFIYVAGGFVWFGSVFNAGLYPNFYGILSSLFIVIAVSMIISEPSRWGGFFVYLVAFTNALFSHYSTLLIFPTLVGLPVLQYTLTRKLDKRMIAIAVVPLALFGIAVGLLPGVLNILEGVFSSQSATSVGGSTTLSQLLSVYPFASFIAAEITSDVATTFLLAMALLGAYVTVRRRNTPLLIPLAWFITVAVVSPTGASAWRFSYAALMPLCLLAAFGFDLIFSRIAQNRRNVRRRGYGRKITQSPRFASATSVVLLLLLVFGSWGMLVVADAVEQGGLNGQAQKDVYASMLWLAENTPADSGVLSVTDFRYVYTGLVANRNSGYAPLISPDEVVQQLGSGRDIYVALTKVSTIANATFNPFPMYENDARFQLVYSNPDVFIFRLNSTVRISRAPALSFSCVSSATNACHFNVGDTVAWVNPPATSKGIFIGKVTSINSAGLSIYTTIRSDPFCNGASPGEFGCVDYLGKVTP